MQVTHPSDHKDLFDKALLEGVNTPSKVVTPLLLVSLFLAVAHRQTPKM